AARLHLIEAAAPPVETDGGRIAYVEIHQPLIRRPDAQLISALADDAAFERLLLRPRLRAILIQRLLLLRVLLLQLERPLLLLGSVFLRFLGQPPGVILRLLRLHPMAAQLGLRVGERPLGVLVVILRRFTLFLLAQ